MDQLPWLVKRELICLLLFTCNYVVSVRRGFLFLWVLGMGYVILLWHSLSLPYNYFAVSWCLLSSSNIVLVYEPHHEKAFNQGFCPGPTKICLQNHRKLPEEENLLFIGNCSLSFECFAL